MQDYPLLSQLKLPDELLLLSMAQRKELCAEIRSVLIDTVSKTGGHLASNLGTVELTVALHTVFRSPQDKLVWDVGHQAYAHKLLTGRYEQFSTLRQEGGISGFPKPSESEHDAFIGGHSSTSISAALGLAHAMKLQGKDNAAVAIIGDGAFTGGLAYEGLNNAGKSGDNIIIVLNHNDMSISKNVGALAKYLTKIRSNPSYLQTKIAVKKTLSYAPLLGKPIQKAIHSLNTAVKNLVYRGTMFEDFGFAYLGPVDGHDLPQLTAAFAMAKELKKPVFVHVNTVKGKGYPYAESNPGEYHSISCFNVETGNPDVSAQNSFSAVFGSELAKLGETDTRLCAITAAMKYGTGLQHFYHAHKERFFDVGIAEQHAVTFAAGLAKGGMLPVFAVYSSFLQRAYDQVLHDVAIENMHIVLGIDRAGVVGEDGETHQGLFDVSLLSSIPHTTILSPSTYDELRFCLRAALYDIDGIAAVRYPRGCEWGKGIAEDIACKFALVRASEAGPSDTLLITYGRLAYTVYTAVDLLQKDGTAADMLKLVQIHPLLPQIMELAQDYKHIFFFEEGMQNGGIAQKLCTALIENGYKGNFHIHAINDQFVKHAKVDRALANLGLDAPSMVKTVEQELKTWQTS